MNERQKALVPGSPVAVLSSLLAAFAEYGQMRFPPEVLALHLRGIAERLDAGGNLS
jgi:hypothetical protein